MGTSVRWSCFAALFSLLFMGQVWCDCTEENVGIEGGHYKLTREQQPGSMLIYYCPEGYYPYPALTRTCQKNGAWKPALKRFPPQTCRLVECPDPNVLEYGTVSPPQERYFVENETTYECDSGYTLRGSSRRVCSPNGKWSGSTPICSRDTGHCADPGIPAGAARTGNLFETGAMVNYSCNNELFLVGSSERTCLQSGEWSGIEPACYFKHTYDSPLEVSRVFGSAIKHHLTNPELVDDTQEGRRIKISKTGKLNIYIAVDISPSMDKQSISEAIALTLTLIEKISSFVVTPNYEIILFARDVFEVVNIVDFRSGKIPLVTVMDKLRSFNIDDRDTFIKDTDLNFAFKTFLERITSVKQQVGDEAFKEERHVLIFFTDGAYNMGEPAPTVQKIKNLVYTNSTTEGGTQSTEENLDIYIFATGVEPFDEDLQPLTVGDNDKHYFRIKDIRNVHELLQEIIDDEEVMGLCGLHIEDDWNRRRMYPWAAFIFIMNEGTMTKCLGSLVSPQFVLTAAHCLTLGTLPEHITVEIDDGAGKLKKVKTVIIHPSYNINARAALGVREYYDYDVALIQLETDIDISYGARPICIPCTKETSNALQMADNSTCAQQEQILLRSQLEKLSFLTRKSKYIDKKEVHAKLGDNRNECIRHALQAEGITTTDPRVAVSDNFLCTGGQTPYRDHIACPGDGGGAVFKEYKHRTIQVALVSWGNKLLCSRGGLVESDQSSRDFHINLFRVVPFLKSVLGNDTQDEYAPLRFLDG
ncbi:complement factor B-like isoform X1 [Takifugu flavidus]|uniref:complement factor B-like isoform X1 n=1 Tax=Takifugu flavidus TaxID=433684 RepID=UPI0025441AAC|nr:complement factor B-like isoform X1 [Takifugu flavidus]